MFKKLCALVAFLFVSGSALAQKGFYLGVGYGNAEIATHDILVAMPQGSIGFERFEDNDSSYKLLAGFRFNKYIALEGTWQDWGKPDSFNTGILDASGIDIVGTVETTGFQLSALGFLPLADGKFDIFGRLGASVFDEKLKFSGFPPLMAIPQQLVNTSRKDKNALFTYGLGVQLNLLQNKNLILRVEWDSTQGDVLNRYDYVGATIGYTFGSR